MKCRIAIIDRFLIDLQGSHYFKIRGRSDFSFRELTARSGRQQREVGRLLGEVAMTPSIYFFRYKKE
jgi:hypothetical protein